MAGREDASVAVLIMELEEVEIGEEVQSLEHAVLLLIVYLVERQQEISAVGRAVPRREKHHKKDAEKGSIIPGGFVDPGVWDFCQLLMTKVTSLCLPCGQTASYDAFRIRLFA